MLYEIFNINNVLFSVPLSGFGTDMYAVSLVELWATVLGLAAVIGAGLNKNWWYPVGILNSIGFIAIFYQIQLYSDLLLNFYFIGMSIFGWIWWSRTNPDGSKELNIRWLSGELQLIGVSAIIVATCILGYFIDIIFNAMAVTVAWVIGTEYTHTPAAMPYWDAFTTVCSVTAMYLLARKYVESWILWVIVDVVCVGLYLYKGVLAMSVEYFVFLLNALVALYYWVKSSKQY